MDCTGELGQGLPTLDRARRRERLAEATPSARFASDVDQRDGSTWRVTRTEAMWPYSGAPVRVVAAVVGAARPAIAAPQSLTGDPGASQRARRKRRWAR